MATLTNKKILLVDDEEPVLRATKRLLERAGYAVAGFSDPRAALAEFVIRPGQYGLVITDVRMPDLNGRQLAEAIEAKRPDLQIIFISGYTDGIITDDDLFAHARTWHYLEKPVMAEHLLFLVDQHLN